MQRLLTALILGLSINAVNAAEYAIDPAHTYPNFTINHLGFSTMYGRFNSTTGTMSLDQAAKTGQVEVVIDAASVDTGHQKRDDHLRSPDFLNVAEFPNISFKSTSVKFDGDNLTEVTGDLTLLGVSKPVVLNVSSMNCGVHPFTKQDVCGFDASASIKRSEFGITYGLEGIGDEMQLMFEVEAVKQ